MKPETAARDAAPRSRGPVLLDPDRAALRLTATYLFLAAGWILLSDLWTAFFVPGASATVLLHSGKGLVFVVVTGAVLWRFLLLQFRRVRDSQQVLVEELTLRQHAEEELRRQKEANEHLADFPRRNPNPMLELGMGGEVLFANDAARALAEACTQGNCAHLLGKELRERFEACLREGRVFQDLESCLGDRILSWCLAPSRKGTVLSYAREITSQMEDRRRLQENEERFRLLVEQARDAIFLHDFEGRLLDVNPQACTSLGYTREELLEHKVFDIEVGISPEEGAALHDRTRRETTVTVEGVHRRKDGTTFPVELQLGLVAVRGGTCVLAGARDISRRKSAERRLRILTRAIEQSPVSVVITDSRGDIEYVNPQFTRLTGYQAVEVLGKNPRILKSGHQSEEVYHDLWTTIIAGGDWHGELLNRKKNGEFYWESASISPVKDDHGTTTHFVAVKEDITERKRLEQTLRESEERHRLLFETAQDAIFILEGGRFVDCNTRALEVFGRPREELMGLTPAEVSPPFVSGTETSKARAGEKMQAALAGRPQVFEWVHVRGDGQVFDCEVNLNRFVFRKQPYLLAIVRDITQRKQSETALRASEERLRLALEAAQMGTFDWNVGSDEILWLWPHQSLQERFSGVNRSEFGGFLKGVHEEDRTTLTRAIDAARTDGNAFMCEFRVLWGADYRWVAVHGRFSFDGAGGEAHLHGVMQDVTRRRENEERLQRVLRERESLLREIHHRVKNNLQIVSSLLYLQSRKIEDPRLLTILRESTDRIRSMALLHENLYRAGDFARIDLGKHIADLCRHLFEAYGADPARILLELDLPSVHLDLDRAVPLGLLLNELVVNALKYAFPEGREGTLQVRQRLNEKGELEIQVADDGVGIPPDCDPHSPKSTGLQLVRSLTGQLRATLEVSRERGTSYSIVIPYVPGPGLPR